MNYTRKQMGDACEMLVAGELTLRGPRLGAARNRPVLYLYLAVD
jgi:hypothetical protein